MKIANLKDFVFYFIIDQSKSKNAKIKKINVKEIEVQTSIFTGTAKKINIFKLILLRYIILLLLIILFIPMSFNWVKIYIIWSGAIFLYLVTLKLLKKHKKTKILVVYSTFYFTIYYYLFLHFQLDFNFVAKFFFSSISGTVTILFTNMLIKDIAKLKTIEYYYQKEKKLFLTIDKKEIK